MMYSSNSYLRVLWLIFFFFFISKRWNSWTEDYFITWWLKKDNSDFLNGLFWGGWLCSYSPVPVQSICSTILVYHFLFKQWHMDLQYTRNCTSRGFHIIAKSYAYCKLKTNKTIQNFNVKFVFSSSRESLF